MLNLKFKDKEELTVPYLFTDIDKTALMLDTIVAEKQKKILGVLRQGDCGIVFLGRVAGI